MADTEQRHLAEGEGGLHRDGAKPRMSDIMDWELLLEAGRIWAVNNTPTEEYPEGKYPDIDGKPNYQSGIRTTKLLDSCQRHLIALHQGEDLDPESGLAHAGHLLCCLSMFVWMRKNRPDMDDRPPQQPDGHKMCPKCHRWLEACKLWGCDSPFNRPVSAIGPEAPVT